MTNSIICLALDRQTLEGAGALTTAVGDMCRAAKAHDLLDRHGPSALQHLLEQGANEVWVDFKFHDTKDTVFDRVSAWVENGAKIITVHASGGIEMMQSAMQAAAGKCEIFAVTLLTSLSDEEIARIYGKERSRLEIAHELALMAKEAGVDGIVCSAQEVRELSQSPNLQGLAFAVPGTRSVGVALGQQKRSGTPRQAVDDGATLLVVGSQVTKAEDPKSAFAAFAAEVNA